MTVQPAPPRSPDQDELQALIEEARERARRRRRRNGAVAVVTVLIVVGGYLLAAQAGGDHGPRTVGFASSSSAPLSVGVGPFWYMRTVGTMRASRCAKPLPGVMNPCGSMVWFDVVMSTETWVGTDGTMRERSVEVSQRFASPVDRARWLASRKPVPVTDDAQGDALDIGSGHFPSSVFGQIDANVPAPEGPPSGAGPIDLGDGPFTYRQLLALPASGPAALSRIDQAWTELRHRYGSMLLRWHSPGATLTARDDLAPIPSAGRAIQELLLIARLDAAPVPPRVRLGLFHAATALAGVTDLPSCGHGRDGVGVVPPVAARQVHVRLAYRRATDRAADGRRGAGRRGSRQHRCRPGPRRLDHRAAEGRQADPWPRRTTAVAVAAHASDREGLARRWSPHHGVHGAAHRHPRGKGSPSPYSLVGDQRLGRPRDLPRRETGVRPPRDLPTGQPGGRSVPPADVAPGLADDDDPPRRPARLRLPRQTPALPPAGMVPGSFPVGFDVLPNPLPPHYTTPPYTGPSGTSVYFEVR